MAHHPALKHGNIAVVTGAALGIGRSLSQRLASLGLKVCMFDIDQGRLDAAASEVEGEALTVSGDVSRLEDLEMARSAIKARWGDAPAVLINNAVLRIGGDINGPLEDWRRAIDVNLFGVVNGVRVFAPSMTARNKPGAIVNLGSKQGITNPPGFTIYNVAKSAVKTYTEGLEHALRQDPNRKVTAHLLVPGWTTTGNDEHKPGAWMPDQLVDFFLEHLARGEFYIICPDDEVTEEMDRQRMLWAAHDLIERRPPLSRWHPEWKPAFAEWVQSLENMSS